MILAPFPTRFSFFRLILFFLFIPGILSAQSFSLTAQPGVVIPTGPYYSAAGEVAYKPGFRMSVQGDYAPGESGFRIGSLLDYTLLPLAGSTSSSMNLLALGAGPAYIFETGGRFRFRAMLAGGYFYGFLGNVSGGNFFTQAKIGGGFSLSPAVDLNLDVDYSYYFGGGDSFSNTFNGIGIGLGVSYKPGAGSRRSGVDIQEENLLPVFPVMYAAYDQIPLGSIVVKNGESGPVEDVRISYYLSRYMDSPRIVQSIDAMKKNEEQEISLYALLDKSILTETEGTAADAEITIDYKYRGINKSTTRRLHTDILYRNALVWDDDRKAAAFVTARDPAVLTLSRNSMNIVRDSNNKGTDPALRQAMAVYEALRYYGLSYVVDPSSSYEELSAGTALDFIQFPVETLTYKAGDCDDLSILFASLMESISIETAFITIPGHIFMAFALNTEPENSYKIFPRSADNLIQYDEKLWIPVEITMVESEGFVKAWRFAAFEWRKYNDQNKAEIWPVREAWQIYKPVGFVSSSKNLEYPAENKVANSYENELISFIQEEIELRVMELEDEIHGSSGRTYQKAVNALGVLYARNGMYDKAIETIKPLSDGNNVYLPSVLNIANLYYLTENLELAVRYYKAAADSLNNPAPSYLGLAMAEYKLGNLTEAENAYSTFAVMMPEKAEKYAFLAGSQSGDSRASSALGSTEVLWEDE